MKRNLVKLEVVFLIGIFVLSAFGIFAVNAEPGDAASSTATRGTRAHDINHDLILTAYMWGPEREDTKFDGPYYLGDKSTSITVYFENGYDNDVWFDSIEQCYINISSTDPIFNVVDGDGSQRWFDYGEQISETYYFDIENSGSLGYGNKITVKAQYVRVNDVGEKRIDSGSLILDLKIRSGIRAQAGAEQNFEVHALTESNSYMKLYAGAKFQKIEVILYTEVNTLDDVEATLSAPPEDIEIESGTEKAMVDSLSWSKSMYWRIDVADNADPGIYTTGSIKFKYVRTYGNADPSDDVTINEPSQSNIVTYIIDYTPVLSPPEDNEFKNTNYEIEQKVDTSQKINVDFRNTGNVGLRNLEVTLDLDNAQYIRPLGFFYDERDWADQSGFGLTQTLDDLPVGDQEQIQFEFFADPSVPPGKYLVPLTYTGYYYDDGSTGQSTGFVQTSNYEFETIEYAIEQSSRGPYIYISVVDSSIDISAKSTTTLVPGSSNIPIYVTLENQENYDFTGVKVYLEASGTTPILMPGDTAGTADKLDPEEVGTLWASSSTTVAFIADVDANAVGGLYDVNLYVTGFDELKNEYTLGSEDAIVKKVQLRVVSIPPDFVITKVTTTPIKPGKSFTLSLSIRNSGGSDASNVYVLFNGTSNLFEAENAVLGPYPLVKENNAQTLTFNLKAGDIEPGSTYAVQIMLSFKDPEGSEVRFNDASPLTLTLRAEPEKEEDEFSIDFGVAIIFGILILLIAIIVAAIIIKGAILPKSKRQQGGVASASAKGKVRGGADDRRAPPPPPAATPAPVSGPTVSQPQPYTPPGQAPPPGQPPADRPSQEVYY